MTSAENSVLEPPNLKISGGGYPRPLHQGSCPVYKRPGYGPVLRPRNYSSSYSLTEILAECHNHFLINHLTSGSLIRDHISGIPP